MSKTIYLVEDNLGISEMISYLLEETGLHVITSPTIADFHRQFKKQEPDLILLDIMLPDGNGIDLCKELKNNTVKQHIPVILMSAHAKGVNVKEECDANDFIAKPFDIDDFTKRVYTQLNA